MSFLSYYRLLKSQIFNMYLIHKNSRLTNKKVAYLAKK